MSKKESFFKKIYDLYLKNVEELYKDESLFERFCLKMDKKYDFRFSLYENESEKLLDKAMNDWIREEYDSWGYRSVEARYWEFTPDEPYEELKRLSGNAFGHAIAFVKGEEINPEELAQLDQWLIRMEELVDQVNDYHKDVAKKWFSEGKLDILHIKGEFPYYSLRVGDYVMHR